MNDTDQDALFRSIADKVIDLANDNLQDNNPVLISTALLFGISRFCAFTVASQVEDIEQYNNERQPATDYYMKEFSRMIGQNLDDYEGKFKEPLKYEHLMKDKE